MRLEARSLALALAAVACAIAAVIAAACIVVPPPDPPNPVRAPRILHQWVTPQEGVPLAEQPWHFIVPVEVDNRINEFSYAVFVDFMDQSNTGLYQQRPVPVTPSSLDGGVVMLLDLWINQQRYDLGICHRIEVMVARSFLDTHIPDMSSDSDSAFWSYEGSGAPYGCPLYDAGIYQDGFAPPADASETLPAIPTESGVDP